MAIDTRNKRASVVGFMRPWSPVWPNPDGSLASVADRQQMAYAYASGSPAAAVTLIPIRTLSPTRHDTLTPSP